MTSVKGLLCDVMLCGYPLALQEELLGGRKSPTDFSDESRGQMSLIVGWPGEVESGRRRLRRGTAQRTSPINGRSSINGTTGFRHCGAHQALGPPLHKMPELKRKLSLQHKILLKGIHALNAVGRMLRDSPVRGAYPFRLFNEALLAFNRQPSVRTHSSDMFDNRLRDPGSVDAMLAIMSNDSPDITISSCGPAEVAMRMISPNQSELLPFSEKYNVFTSASPYLVYPFLERIKATQYGLMRSVLDRGVRVSSQSPSAYRCPRSIHRESAILHRPRRRLNATE